MKKKLQWTRPTLKRLEAGAAEGGRPIFTTDAGVYS